MQKAKINHARLVMQSVAGMVRHPYMGSPYRIDHEGAAHVLPATGAITYNVKIGDSVYAMEGDHIEPGVTVLNPDKAENAAFNTLTGIILTHGSDSIMYCAQSLSSAAHSSLYCR